MILSSRSGREHATFREGTFNRCITWPSWWSAWTHSSIPPITMWTQDIFSNVGWKSHQILEKHLPIFTRWSTLGRFTISWSSLPIEYMIRRKHKPFLKGGWSYWTTWWIMGGHSTGRIYWLIRRRSMWLRLRICLRMRNKWFTCFHIYWMQSVPNNSSLAWARHGHQKKLLSTSIASFFQTASIEEWWQG